MIPRKDRGDNACPPRCLHPAPTCVDEDSEQGGPHEKTHPLPTGRARSGGAPGHRSAHRLGPSSAKSEPPLRRRVRDCEPDSGARGSLRAPRDASREAGRQAASTRCDTERVRDFWFHHLASPEKFMSRDHQNPRKREHSLRQCGCAPRRHKVRILMVHLLVTSL